MRLAILASSVFFEHWQQQTSSHGQAGEHVHLIQLPPQSSRAFRQMETEGQNPFSHLLSEIKIGNDTFKYYNLLSLNDPRYEQLPFSIRVLLESAVRNCDNFQVKEKDIHNILAWEENQGDASGIEVPFKPSRVILQDFTGVPAVVDFAAMRDVVKDLGGDPDNINPVCPADLVIDHSVQVEFSRTRVAGGGGGGGGGGGCNRCVNLGHPLCMASWPSRHTATCVSRPTSPALRSRPVSPIVRSGPSSPVMYPTAQPVYYIPPPWTFQSTIPSPATPLATFQPLAMGEAATYQILQGYQVPVYSSQPQYGPVYQPTMQYSQVVKPQHPSSYYLGSAYTHHGSIPSSRPTTPENIHTLPTHVHTPSVDVEDLGQRLRRRPSQNPTHKCTHPTHMYTQPQSTETHTQPQPTQVHTQPQPTHTHTQPQPTHTQPTHTHTQPTHAHTHSVDVEDATTKPPTSEKTPSIYVEDLATELQKPPPQSPRPGQERSIGGVRESVSVRSGVTERGIESSETGSNIDSEGRGRSTESGGGEGDTEQERSTRVKESVSVPSDITVGNIQVKGMESNIQSKETGRNTESTGTDFRDNESDVTSQSNITSSQSGVISSESDVTSIGSNVTRIRSDVTSSRYDVTSTRYNIVSTCSNVTSLQRDLTSFQTNVPTTGVQGDKTSLHSDTTRTCSDVTSVQSDQTSLQSNESRRSVPSRSLNTHSNATSIRGSVPARSSRSNMPGFQSAVTSPFSDVMRTGSGMTVPSDLMSTSSDITSARSEVTPSLKLPVSSLPSPLDVPGIPIQDEVCPFHKEPSEWSDALQKNQDLEFERNYERFVFLKWGAQALKNMLIVPPGSGIVHQVNLEYLARVVFNENGVLFPDSLVGTDSHTTMINGLGVLGWGVGGIEAEAVMLGQAVSMVLPKVVGYCITGTLSPLATSTDVVLTITKHLRQVGVVGKFVEFYGPGVQQLSLADRATISNMCPEYGATVGFFPVDDTTINYLRQSNRDEGRIKEIEEYLKAVRMFRNFMDTSQDPVFSETVTLDLGDVVPSLSGPKRPHDRVSVAAMKQDFLQCLSNQVGFKGFGLPADQLSKTVPFVYEGGEYTLQHGSVVIAAITSCTNTSNPSVMLGAGLLAKKAVESGLCVAPYIKTSLSPGSGVVTHYLQHSGVTPYLNSLGFTIVGYGCMTCIGNSGPIPDAIVEAIEKNDLVCCGVLSGNRNFEGRIHPNTRANYLASPLLVIAYAIAGRVDIDFETEPIGTGKEGNPVFLRDIWPSRSEVQEVEQQYVVPALFSDVYKRITTGNTRWNNLQAPEGTLYPWDQKSTYIKKPPFFDGMTKELAKPTNITGAYVLLNLGDSVTTDHISPAGSIARNSAAARYLASRGLTPRDFNSYGSRRGNDAVMARGTFANIRLRNKFVGKAGPRTIHIPSGEELDVFDAAERYREEGKPVIILAGKEYGSGSSRDWAAKGPFLLGVRAVIAESYERIHRSNLVGMGIIPLQYLPGQTADTLGLTGREKFTIDLPDTLKTGMTLTVKADDKAFDTIMRFDTDVELTYFHHGGILNYMIRKIANTASV